MSQAVRAEGLTPSERYLKRLCERSFLRMWSFPNPHRDDGKGNGKELCDLLVVFGHHIVIFSDKSCAYPDTGDPALDWARWYKRAVVKSADQVHGAERWLRDFPQRVFVDVKCERPFPLELPSKNDAIFHRVVVALGSSERNRAFNGGSGSLSLCPSDNDVNQGKVPFQIGDLDPKRGYVHVLDDVTLDTIVGELDTIRDFLDYLVAKEALVRSGKLGFSPGEEDLLSYYLRNVDSQDRHCFKIPKNVDLVAYAEGGWEALHLEPAYLRKKQADSISFVWDKLVEQFTEHVLGGTLEFGNHLGIQPHEKALRIMAAEPRTSRRQLAKGFMSKYGETDESKGGVRLMGTRQRADVGYVVLFEPVPPEREYESYRTFRRNKLEVYCRVAKYLNPKMSILVGIASESRSPNGASEDLLYLDTASWNEADEAQAKQWHEAGILKNATRSETTTYEFPPKPSLREDPEARRARNRRKRQKQQRR